MRSVHDESSRLLQGQHEFLQIDAAQGTDRGGGGWWARRREVG